MCSAVTFNDESHKPYITLFTGMKVDGMTASNLLLAEEVILAFSVLSLCLSVART